MKINTLEKEIIALLNAPNDAFLHVWARFLDYYTTKDALEHSCHLAVIHAVYAKEQPRALKHVALSCDLHVSERTLYRYRKEYLRCLAFMAAQLNFPLNLHTKNA